MRREFMSSNGAQRVDVNNNTFSYQYLTFIFTKSGIVKKSDFIRIVEKNRKTSQKKGGVCNKNKNKLKYTLKY